MSDSIIIIPTYNERENVQKMMDAILNLSTPFDLLFIDDASPDKTSEIIEEMKKQHPERIFLEKRKGKLGLGTAYIHGFNWALKKEYRFIFEMDCDFSHNPNDLIRLHDAIKKEGDLVVGSRYCSGGRVKNWHLISRGWRDCFLPLAWTWRDTLLLLLLCLFSQVVFRNRHSCRASPYQLCMQQHMSAWC